MLLTWQLQSVTSFQCSCPTSSMQVEERGCLNSMVPCFLRASRLILWRRLQCGSALFRKVMISKLCLGRMFFQSACLQQHGVGGDASKNVTTTLNQDGRCLPLQRTSTCMTMLSLHAIQRLAVDCCRPLCS
jgi:hypothetical protein